MINPLITINAPIDGTVIARKVGPGQYVRSDSGDPLYSIADLSTMWLKANVPENDIPLVRVGQEIEVRVTGAARPRVQGAHHRHRRGLGCGDAARGRALGDPQSGRRAQVGDVRDLQDRHRRRRACARRAGRGRDPGRRRWPSSGSSASRCCLQRRKVKLGMEQDGRVQVREGLKPGERVVGARRHLRRQRVAAMIRDHGADAAMLRSLIAFCLSRRPLVLISFAAFLALGYAAFTALNIEAYPDPAPPIIEIIAQ